MVVHASHVMRKEEVVHLLLGGPCMAFCQGESMGYHMCFAVHHPEIFSGFILYLQHVV